VNTVDFPSFQDFLDDVGEERRFEWTQLAQQEIKHLMPIHPPLDEISMSHFGTALGLYSHKLTILMLADYHEWLIRQLSTRSFRLL